MKTIFDVVHDGLSCSVPVWDPFCFFRCQMFPFNEYCKGKDFVLYGPDANLLGHNLWLIACWKNIFGVINEDDTYSFFMTDGSIIDEKITSFRLFEAGMLALVKDKKATLYRLDGSVVHQGACSYEVAPDGNSFFVKDSNELWKLLLVDGACVAENISGFLMKSSDFYALRFNDGRAVVYDKKTHTQFDVPQKAMVQLLECGLFTVQGLAHKILYRADGTKLLEGDLEYFCFDNGLIWANPHGIGNCLYNQNLKPLLKNPGTYCADDFGRLFRNDKDYVFNHQGELVACYPFNTTMACGNGYFLAWNEKQNVVALHRPDNTIVAENVVGAIVYPNQWKVLFYSDNRELRRLEPAPIASLLDDKDNVIVDKVDVLTYLYNTGGYVYAKGGKYFLVDAQGQIIEDAADYICVFGDLYVVERQGQKTEVHFLIATKP